MLCVQSENTFMILTQNSCKLSFSVHRLCFINLLEFARLSHWANITSAFVVGVALMLACVYLPFTLRNVSKRSRSTMHAWKNMKCSEVRQLWFIMNGGVLIFKADICELQYMLSGSRVQGTCCLFVFFNWYYQVCAMALHVFMLIKWVKTNFINTFMWDRRQLFQLSTA